MPKGSWKEFDDSPAMSRPNSLASDLPQNQQKVRVQRMRVGKSGKTVTLITGLKIDQIQAKEILKTLKTQCGTGGTLKDDSIELQGDKVDAVIKFLELLGYRPKKIGG